MPAQAAQRSALTHLQVPGMLDDTVAFGAPYTSVTLPFSERLRQKLALDRIGVEQRARQTKSTLSSHLL